MLSHSLNQRNRYWGRMASGVHEQTGAVSTWFTMSEPVVGRGLDEGESSGGGGGSRTRVRKYGLRELYMRVRF